VFVSHRTITLSLSSTSFILIISFLFCSSTGGALSLDLASSLLVSFSLFCPKGRFLSAAMSAISFIHHDSSYFERVLTGSVYDLFSQHLNRKDKRGLLSRLSRSMSARPVPFIFRHDLIEFGTRTEVSERECHVLLAFIPFVKTIRCDFDEGFHLNRHSCLIDGVCSALRLTCLVDLEMIDDNYLQKRPIEILLDAFDNMSPNTSLQSLRLCCPLASHSAFKCKSLLKLKALTSLSFSSTRLSRVCL